ncbi:MAG: ion transporter [Paracoccaceae bacterium]|nr:MAG: ion transporter [Paracoccaceae bacterium]
MTSIHKLVDDRQFQSFIIGVILVNAAILGLLTLDLSPGLRKFLELLDNLCLVVFVAEIAMKLFVYRGQFFRDGWNIFDAVVVGIALLPATGSLSVLRALRVLRVLRLATAVPSMRRVINGMFAALPGGASIAGILFIMYYVGAIIGVTLFSKNVPQYFGDIGTTFFTLFQLMTLEGWNGIADEVIVHHPRAWIFFVCFIIFTNFTTLNLLFGIIVDAMEKAKEEEVREEMAVQGVEVEEVSDGLRLAKIEEDVKHIRAMLARMEAERIGA